MKFEKGKYKIYSLGDIADMKYGKMPKKGMVQESGKYPVFSGYRIVGYCNECNLNEQQLIVVARGVGGTGDVKLSPGACYLTNLSIAVIINEKIALKKYIFYYFRQHNLRYLDSGSAQSQITISDLKNIRVPVPPLNIQKKIVDILSLFDEKIALNNKINDNLEQQVYTLFESYFINLDKTNGIIPDDWHKGTLGDIAFITSGKRPPVKQSIPTTEAAIPLVGAAAVMGYTNSALYKEPILITGRVGTHGVVQRFQIPCWPSDNTLVIKSNFYEYTYQVLKRIDYKNMNRGSTQPLITQTDLKNKPIMIPSKTVLTEFEKIAEHLMTLYELNRKENEKLTALRDTLLPKLMSGEIELDKI